MERKRQIKCWLTLDTHGIGQKKGEICRDLPRLELKAWSLFMPVHGMRVHDRQGHGTRESGMMVRDMRGHGMTGRGRQGHDNWLNRKLFALLF